MRFFKKKKKEGLDKIGEFIDILSQKKYDDRCELQFLHKDKIIVQLSYAYSFNEMLNITDLNSFAIFFKGKFNISNEKIIKSKHKIAHGYIVFIVENIKDEVIFLIKEIIQHILKIESGDVDVKINLIEKF